MTGMNLITHTMGSKTILQRPEDGYLNATAICNAGGKKMSHYLSNATTASYIEALAGDAGIPASELIQVVKGGNGQQGTWVHPKVAIHLAQWLSPEFAVQVTNWVYDWMMGQRLPPVPVAGSPALPFLPMSDEQQRGLSDMVYKRARTSGSTVQKIYKELRDVFEVSSWKDIPAEKYTEARMLVKSMVLDGELMPRQTAVVPVAPAPIPHRRDEVLVSAADWQLIVEAFRTLSVAMDEAWDSQGGRSANHYCNPAPRAVQLPYDVASGMSRVIGKVYGYTFGMMRHV